MIVEPKMIHEDGAGPVQSAVMEIVSLMSKSFVHELFKELVSVPTKVTANVKVVLASGSRFFCTAKTRLFPAKAAVVVVKVT